jgi:hypothetical protein
MKDHAYYNVDMVSVGLQTIDDPQNVRDYLNSPPLRSQAGMSETELEMSGSEGDKIAQALRTLGRAGETLVEKKVTAPKGQIAYRVRSTSLNEDKGPNGRTESLECTLAVIHVESGAETKMIVTVRWKNYHSQCWLNIQASPTSLLAGVNAAASGRRFKRAAANMLRLLRYPYSLLERILAVTHKGFKFGESTQAAVKTGQIQMHNVQLSMAIYMQDQATQQRFLSFLAAAYTAYVVTDTGKTYQLGALKNLQVQAYHDGDKFTGVMFRQIGSGSRSVTTVNFYSKLAKLGDRQSILSDETIAFLDQHLRLDITLHRPMLDRVMKAAGLKEGKTVADLAKALAAFGAGKAANGQPFRKWLLSETLDHYLHLPAVLKFDPKALSRAKKKLTSYKRLMAVWDTWTGQSKVASDEEVPAMGGMLLLGPLLEEAGASPNQRAKIFKRLRDLGVDPAVPQNMYHRLALITLIWGLSDAEAARIAAGIGAGDKEVLQELLRASRKYLTASRKELRFLLKSLKQPVPLPDVSYREPSLRLD